MRGEITPQEFQRRVKAIRRKYDKNIEEICNMNNIITETYFDLAKLIEEKTAAAVRETITKISNNKEITDEISVEDLSLLKNITTKLTAPKARKLITSIYNNEEDRNNIYITAMGKSCIISDYDDEREF